MKVKINTHGNALPEVHGEWIDLCTAEDVTLDFLEYKIISLGVSIEIPAGYYAHVVPRSSTFGKWGILLANSMGVIENDYCGDGDVWGYPGAFWHQRGPSGADALSAWENAGERAGGEKPGGGGPCDLFVLHGCAA